MISFVSRSLIACTATILLVSTGLSQQSVSARSVSYELNIPAENLDSALQALALASHHKLFYRAELVSGKLSKELVGTYTTEEAVSHLLEGSALSYEITASGVVLIRDASEIHSQGSPASLPSTPQSSQNGSGGEKETSRDFRLAQNSGAPVDQGSAGPQAIGSDQDSEKKKQEGLTEIVVTGTHIKGAIPSSPVVTISASDIEASGYSTVGEVMRALPQNFSGGTNPTVVAGGTNINNTDNNGASSVNLRGLGPGATLSLLDGQRQSYGGTANFVDISIIPTALIDRIEILTDGASAIYGSDAIAGASNIILKKKYEGAETSLRYDWATQGGGAEKRVNQLFGQAWGSGGIVMDFEFNKQEELFATDRDFIGTTVPFWSIVPATKQSVVFSHLDQEFGDRVALQMDAHYSYQNYQLDQGTNASEALDRNAGVSGSLNAGLGGDWTWSLDGTFSVNDESTNVFARDPVSFIKSLSYNILDRNTLAAISTGLTGTAFSLPSGPVRAAVGIGYRRESLDYTIAPYSSETPRRNVDFAYAELNAPLVAPDESRVGLKRLELSFAGRVERYSDVGSSTVPKLGLAYKPTNDLTLRGSWGRSFRAPNLDQVYGTPLAVAYDATFYGFTTPANGQVVELDASNRNLRPEKANTWTVGGDYLPFWLPGFRANLTYYHINYTDRVGAPMSNSLLAFSDPHFASFVVRNPTPAQVTAAIAGKEFIDGTFTTFPYDVNNVVGLVDNQYANIAGLLARGVDVLFDYAHPFAGGSIHSYLNLSTEKLGEKVIPTISAIELDGTLFNPPHLKVRGGTTVTHGPWSISAAANFTDSETYLFQGNTYDVSSYLTIDSQVAYRFENAGGGLHGLTIFLSAVNLFDKNPPYVNPLAVLTGQAVFNYDPANTNPIGRVISLTLSKAW